MSTPATIKTALQAAITKANSTTGAGDTNLTDAVDSLIEGYGKGGIEPSGSITLTANGTYDVTEKAQAVVNVPASGITPSGTKEITANGEHDVTQYAKVNVNVATAAESPKVVRRTVTLANMTGASAYYPTILTGDDFVKQNYANDAFFILMRPVGAVAASAYAITGMYHGNRLLVDGSSDFYGFAIQYNSAGTASAFFGNVAKVSGTGYNAGFRAKSSGNVDLVLPANRNISAGTYELIIGCVTD